MCSRASIGSSHADVRPSSPAADDDDDVMEDELPVSTDVSQADRFFKTTFELNNLIKHWGNEMSM